MSSVIHTDTKPVDKFAAEGNQRQCNGNERQHKSTDRVLGSWSAQKPADNEQHGHDHIAAAGPQSNSFRPRAAGYCQPIHQAENGGQQPADDTGSNHPGRDTEPFGVTAGETDDVVRQWPSPAVPKETRSALDERDDRVSLLCSPWAYLANT